MPNTFLHYFMSSVLWNCTLNHFPDFATFKSWDHLFKDDWTHVYFLIYSYHLNENSVNLRFVIELMIKLDLKQNRLVLFHLLGRAKAFVWKYISFSHRTKQGVCIFMDLIRDGTKYISSVLTPSLSVLLLGGKHLVRYSTSYWEGTNRMVLLFYLVNTGTFVMVKFIICSTDD